MAASTSSNGAPKSRRELFEEAVRPPPQRWSIQQCSLRREEPVASTSRAVSGGLRTGSLCSYSTLQQFRAQDKDRKSRLKSLYQTLKQEWAAPHHHDDDDDAEDIKSAYPPPNTAEQRRVKAVRTQYLKELYHTLCPGTGEDAKGKGPTLETFTQFVEQKEEALWKLFCEIDHDNDMHLQPAELQSALAGADIKISSENLAEMIREMDKTGSGRVSFQDWRDFLLLLPRPTSMSNIWTYWKSHSKQPRLATSIANQDLDIILAEKPSPPSSSASFAAGTASGGKASANAASGESASQRIDASSSAESGQESAEGEAEDGAAITEDESGIFDGSAAYLLAGGLAGAVSRTATAPFDRLKVYLINTVNPSSAKLPSVTKTATHPISAAKDLSKSGSKGVGVFANAIRDLYTQGGIKAFFVGNGLNILKIFPESAIKFWSYEYSKRWFARNVDHSTVAEISGSSRFIAGGLGGVTSQLLIYPLETWKTRVMSSTSSSGLKGNALYAATAKDMIKNGGIRAYYSGLAMGLIGVFPYSAIDMSLFAAFKKAYTKYTGVEEPGPLGSLTFGALSGGLGATSVYPLNLLRTRMQTQGTPAHPQVYTGWRDVAARCYRNEGLKGFYKGLSPTLLKVSPSMGISWVVYEYSTALFFPRHDGEDREEETSES